MSRTKTNPRKTNINDVLIASINKGLAPYFLVTILLLALILTSSRNEACGILIELVNLSKKHNNIGWYMFSVSTLSFVILRKKSRSKCEQEIRRLSEEKAELQSKLANRKFNSSNQ